MLFERLKKKQQNSYDFKHWLIFFVIFDYIELVVHIVYQQWNDHFVRWMKMKLAVDVVVVLMICLYKISFQKKQKKME